MKASRNRHLEILVRYSWAQAAEAAVWEAVSAFCFGNLCTFVGQGLGSLGILRRPSVKLEGVCCYHWPRKWEPPGWGLKEALAASNEHSIAPDPGCLEPLLQLPPVREGEAPFIQCSGEDCITAMAQCTALEALVYAAEHKEGGLS